MHAMESVNNMVAVAHTNVEYVCRLYSLPNPEEWEREDDNRPASSSSSSSSSLSSSSFDQETRRCGTVECWSIAEALHQRASLAREPRPRLVFLDAAAAFYTAALADPSRALTASLEHQLARDIDRCTADQQTARYAAAFPALPTTGSSTTSNSSSMETCEGCAEAVGADALHELGRAWHRPCFLLRHVCAHCGRSIATDPLAYVVGDAIRGTFDTAATPDTAVATRPVFHGKCRAEALAGLERVAALPARRFSARVVLAQRHANPGSAIPLRVTIEAGDQHGHLLHRGARGVSHVELRLLCHEMRPRHRSRSSNSTRRVTRTTVVNVARSTLGRQLPNDTHRPARIEAALEYALPATLPRTHTHDTGFAREYELQVRIHFSRFYRRPLSVSFNIVVLGERLHHQNQHPS